MLRVNASPYVRAILTVDEWTTLNSLNLDGFLLLLADSKRGPFTVKLAANGIRVRGEGNTVGEALASVVAQVAA